MHWVVALSALLSREYSRSLSFPTQLRRIVPILSGWHSLWNYIFFDAELVPQGSLLRFYAHLKTVLFSCAGIGSAPES